MNDTKAHQPSEEEKEYLRRHKNWEKVRTEITDATELLSQKAEEMFRPIQQQLLNAVPVQKKDVKMNGKDIFVSVTRDAKVVFQFGDLESAQRMYEQTESGFWNSMWKKIRGKN